MLPSPTLSFVKGSDREVISTDEAKVLERSGVLITDERRSRTRYFDGRFLAAKDEMRDQNYFLTRLADLGRAAGSGVVSGLMVSLESSATLIIEPGQGLTPAGESLMVPNAVTVVLNDIAGAEQLDVAFGLSRVPNDPARNRTGLFVLGLRPVEYTANPIASYPTSVNGPRSLQDGDIIEAAAIVMVPFDRGGQGTLDARRGRAARQIFLEQAQLGVPANVLPLAIVALDRGVVQWLDPYLARREVGAGPENILRFGLTPRAIREAGLQQYLAHLEEILHLRSNGNLSHEFSAAEYFETLPAAGMLPAAAINPTDFSQIYFPSQIETDISIIPADELPVLVEESFMLPPIDLTSPGDELESTSVLILVPIPRPQLPSFKLSLESVAKPLRAAAPGMLFQRKPLQALASMTALRLPPAPVVSGSTIDAAWRQALGQNPLLWYVRRRNLHLSEEVTGTRVPVSVDEEGAEKAMADRLTAMGLNDRVNVIQANATTAAKAEVNARLASPALAHPILAESAVTELEQPLKEQAKLDHATVLKATAPFNEPRLGEGIARLEAANPALKQPEIAKTVAAARVGPELDRLGRNANEATAKAVADHVVKLATTPPVEPIHHELPHPEPLHPPEPPHPEPGRIIPSHTEPPHVEPRIAPPHPPEPSHPEPTLVVPPHPQPPHVAINQFVLGHPVLGRPEVKR